MNTCQLIHLIVFFLLGLKWLDLLLPVKAYFELTEVFLKEKKIGKPFWIEFPPSACHEPQRVERHLVTFYVQVQ